MEPALPEQIAPAFESLRRRWVRSNLDSEASRVGAWGDPALRELRAKHEREVSVSLLGEIEKCKLPALRQSGAKVKKDGLRIILSRSGFTDGPKRAAAESERLRLVEPRQRVLPRSRPGDRGLPHSIRLTPPAWTPPDDADGSRGPISIPVLESRDRPS